MKRRYFMLALLASAMMLLMIAGAVWILTPMTALAQNTDPTVLPTVTPWGGRRGVMPGGAAPLFPYWLAGLPIIAIVIALLVRVTRRTPAQK